MKRIVLFGVFLCWTFLGVQGQHVSEWQAVTCTNPSDKMAVFKTTGVGEKKKELAGDAKKRLFYALFYKGVEGINEGLPLVENEDVTITRPFIDSGRACEAYIIEITESTEPEKKGGVYRATYTVTLSVKMLTDFLIERGVMENAKAYGAKGGPVMPSIMVVPFIKGKEQYKDIMENDFESALAVSIVRDGFRSRNITTYDVLTMLDARGRRATYETNKGVAESADKQLLMSSGADVIVEVRLAKNLSNGNQVSLIMDAKESATGALLGSEEAVMDRFSKASMHRLIKYAVEDNIDAFLNHVCANWKKPGHPSTEGIRVVLQFAIDGTSAMTFNDRVGAHNYSLANLIRQWVRKNCHQAQYHLQGINDESIIFDSVTMPPIDQDGLPMDAAQFSFLLESYLKEDNGVDCSVRIEGNSIMFTIH